ncbi:MAG: TrmB family transcriptional regulator [Candidatus Thorarchaeota archaeon]|nr:TrmB family transcriptional regulator [Candidatus Thorarchaeota archaeon]MCK5238688.1 TrmB family transcriptional regulator [Candidatus Thorarchaeota archaeon]
MSLSEGTLKALKELGLTEYEVQAYVALVDGGMMSASDISTKSGVPFSRVYDVLGRLEEKGFIQIQRGRPTIYVAKSPQEIVRLVRLAWEEKLEKSSKIVVNELQPRFERETPATRTRDVWLLHGRPNILAKALEMLEGAREEILLNLPSLDKSLIAEDDETEDLTEIVESVLRHKVGKICILTSSVPPEMKDMIPPEIEIRCRDSYGAGLVVDRRETLIMLAGGDSESGFLGVFSSAPVFAAMASSYFDNLWSQSEPI